MFTELLFDTAEYSVIDEDDSDQRYTKPQELALVKKYLGVIGLDPTANPARSVPALAHITEQQDCLVTSWTPYLRQCPTVFMNPPYSDSAKFLARMGIYLGLGDITKAVTLTLSGVLQNKKTQPLIRQYAKAVIAPCGRLNFIGSGDANDRDVIWIAWGEDTDIQSFGACFQGLLMEVRR